MRKDIGDKIYSIIIIILVFSIVYQTSFLLVNTKDSTPVVLSENYIVENEEQEMATNNSATTELELKENEVEKNSDDFSADQDVDISLYMYLVQQVIPYNSKTSNYTLKDIIKYITKVDFNDPKTLISSQIPIIHSYEEDNVEISVEEEKEIYSITASKPLNSDEVEVNNTSDKPLVLLYSTHTTESYTSTDKTKIDYTSYARTTNEEHNVLAVGAEVKKVLEEKYGIVVVHDTTVHDYPSYAQSYSNSLETIKKNLKKYPSIQYVFDIHRDGLVDNPSNKEKYATVVNEVNSAKIMMVVGLNHDNSAMNLKFSEKVYQGFKEMYPSIALPTVKRSTAKYNQFARDNAMLFEVGSNLSTLEEAKASGKFLGDVLGKVITDKENN
ncbi:hypothetical protein GC105_02335 [Alkalibaculum sp. M08DMB]|uniref:Stage II sporulation protein P n=1 Tax=Alkalibaculum sporogenes TaxID=2655001 RepID=A0A6A7K5K6_9FIRM|nr:stage II sporulation protein P [Alkalibaculum sporogenes]MPW24631.1 hypothetical protein [Alkalibaculum sporogenes]